ncbi:MAG: PilZ domain-containing protein [Desulfocapsaceae bacterium]
MDKTAALRKIPDLKPVRIYLPIKNNKQRYRTQAIYKSVTPPLFELRFHLGTIPLDNLDLEKNCLVNVDFGGPNISMEASIASVSIQTLRMTAEELVTHDQMREFFRVDTVTEVISKSFQPEFFNNQGQSWAIRGKTIDISGNGILAAFSEKMPDDELVRLEISLPARESQTIKILAKPVRNQQIEVDQWETAYHFQDISSEDRDRIIGCCLDIQRQFLRLKVDVTN